MRAKNKEAPARFIPFIGESLREAKETDETQLKFHFSHQLKRELNRRHIHAV